jgi:hypothetical protein
MEEAPNASEDGHGAQLVRIPAGPCLANPAWPSHDEIVALTSQLDFAAEFEADGVQYSELDEDGQVLVRFPPTAPQ